MAIRYWLAVVQHDHVLRGIALGIAQVNHGARAPLAAMNVSDGFVYYSPRKALGGEPLKAFTAIGRIADDTVYQATDGEFRPWRRRVEYRVDAEPAPIRPLIGALDFTRNAPNWGYQLRRGLIELTKHDFEVIGRQMRPSDPADRPR
jgi:hypothetical protein